MNGLEEQTTKSPNIAFLPTREMRGSKNSKDSTPLSLVRPPSRDVFVLNTIVCSALFKLRLCKHLYSKTLLNSEIHERFSSNQFVVALYYFQFLVAEFMFAL